MAAGVSVIHPNVAFLGSCKHHSRISWPGRQPQGTGNGTLGKMLWPSHFAAWFPLQTLLPHPNRNYLLCRIQNERPSWNGKDPSHWQIPILPTLAGSLRRGKMRDVRMGIHVEGLREGCISDPPQGWYGGIWGSPGRVCVTTSGLRVMSAKTKWKRAGEHVLSSAPLPMAPDGDHMESKVKVQQMNLIL